MVICVGVCDAGVAGRVQDADPLDAATETARMTWVLAIGLICLAIAFADDFGDWGW